MFTRGITVSFASRQVCLARFRKPASLSCSLSQVCELHRSRSCEIASCIALAVEQVCDLHVIRGGASRLLFSSSQIIVITFVVRGGFLVIAFGNLRKENIAVTFAGKRGDCSFSRSFLEIKNTQIGQYRKYNHNKNNVLT